MVSSIKSMAVYCKMKIDNWFARMFDEQAGGAELIATLVIVGIVLALALIFREKLIGLVQDLWNNLVVGKPSDTKEITNPAATWGPQN